MTEFEDKVREWTKPLNGQYPRPWMSDLTDPTTATTFIVGRNQATPFPVELVGTQEQFLDALFNRNGQTHSALYQNVRAQMGKGSSPIRGNIERLTAVLREHGVTGVLETNVICYSTPMSADLANAAHRGGKETGTRISARCFGRSNRVRSLRTVKARVQTLSASSERRYPLPLRARRRSSQKRRSHCSPGAPTLRSWL
jgi:hypothetical protein